MTNTHKTLILLGVVISSVTIATLTQTDKEVKQQNFIHEFNKNMEPKGPSQNYEYDPQTNKIVPKTVLSSEDAKKDCKVCHPDK